MIELAHIASGAVAGSRFNEPISALLAGAVTHVLMDVAPHGEVHDTKFEAASSVAAIATLAAAHGLRSPLVWGAMGGALPDIEHVLPQIIRPKTPLFPSHRFAALHSSNSALAIPAWVQVVTGGAIVGMLAAVGLDKRKKRR